MTTTLNLIRVILMSTLGRRWEGNGYGVVHKVAVITVTTVTTAITEIAAHTVTMQITGRTAMK
ncbi:hypothetical protein C1X21_03325 [Pseudomonas sp. FW305-3-2-15-A-LB2]|nr:hypothetical protein C1X17_05010 [Pseudomonas sp. FW305-3-2-15-C-TSA2]PMV31401.1 hypothetical protein C1X22_04720 [Pseudomonas sp. DP16D-L5]PMV41723.1 hypothetical protein C1X21_03325 [Pseudomonas sp. FW305-3-2-15-A-LB2]PMV46697.1 hypothetical protein C1X16_10150 [Pseudomonas sp. FW305-3-2-15-C-R2A1]PMV54073.1 hypothetical protein C1X18_04910 [Pseudomonas sp. FW305-3-2-15-C-LB1]PMV58785.1 hypothetical protein C1X19_04680 [Pseudomonas sp. GW460-4]PMV65232.1 hypothetical protein C1X20_05030 